MNLLPLWGSVSSKFVVSQSNVRAFNLINNPDTWPNRTLIIYGSWGKSHLARDLHANHRYEYVTPGAEHTSDRLLWDNFTEVLTHSDESLLHYWNQTIGTKASLCVTMRNAPQTADIRPRDLQSRMSSALSVRIKAPDYELRRKIFVQWLRNCDIEIDVQALNYFFAHYDGDLPILGVRAEGLRNHILRYQCAPTIKRIQDCFEGELTSLP